MKTLEPKKVNTSEARRRIAYSMDWLLPGLYVWIGKLAFSIGGAAPIDKPHRYSGTVHSFAGIALVLPGYRIFSTYKGDYDP